MEGAAARLRTPQELQAAKADVDSLVACGLLLPADAEKQCEALRLEALEWLQRDREARSAGEGRAAAGVSPSAGSAPVPEPAPVLASAPAPAPAKAYATARTADPEAVAKAVSRLEKAKGPTRAVLSPPGSQSIASMPGFQLAAPRLPAPRHRRLWRDCWSLWLRPRRVPPRAPACSTAGALGADACLLRARVMWTTRARAACANTSHSSPLCSQSTGPPPSLAPLTGGLPPTELLTNFFRRCTPDTD